MNPSSLTLFPMAYKVFPLNMGRLMNAPANRKWQKWCYKMPHSSDQGESLNLPPPNSCHAETRPSHMERPCVGSLANSPAGHSLQVTAAQKPGTWVEGASRWPRPQTRGTPDFGILPTEALDNLRSRVKLSPLCPVQNSVHIICYHNKMVVVLCHQFWDSSLCSDR